MGAIYNPIGVALAAGAGSALGEISGYLIGFSGQGVVENKVRYQRILTWMREHTHLRNLAILVLAFIPNPLFDLAGIAAGTLRVPITSFLFFTLLGKIGKMLLFAYLGASSLDWFTK
jgi:membrane protein YqaA with SNARE-associated domain